MLFDLRGAGRRRTVQAIYLTLAILMGGGLVLFGVGGNVQGGLVDAFKGGGGSNPDDTFKKQVQTLEKRLAANPRDARTWAALARARFQTASTDIDPQTGTYNAQGRAKLAQAGRAWDRYLSLAGSRPDPQVANLMVQAFASIGAYDKAASAMEIVIADRPKSFALYAQLAQYAYAAGQQRKGDLARDKAVALAPKDQKETVKAQLAQAQTEALKQQAQQQQQAAPATTAP